jgi:hypothetical protein
VEFAPRQNRLRPASECDGIGTSSSPRSPRDRGRARRRRVSIATAATNAVKPKNTKTYHPINLSSSIIHMPPAAKSIPIANTSSHFVRAGRSVTGPGKRDRISATSVRRPS